MSLTQTFIQSLIAIFPSNVAKIIKDYMLFLEYSKKVKLFLLERERLVNIELVNNRLFVMIQELPDKYGDYNKKFVVLDTYEIKNSIITKINRHNICLATGTQMQAKFLFWKNSYVWMYVSSGIGKIFKYDTKTHKIISGDNWLNLNIYHIDDKTCTTFGGYFRDAVYIGTESTFSLEKYCMETGKKIFHFSCPMFNHDVGHKMCISHFNNDPALCVRESKFHFQIIKLIQINDKEYRLIHNTSEKRQVKNNGIIINIEPLDTDISRELIRINNGDFIETNFPSLHYEWYDDTYIPIDYYNIEYGYKGSILTKNIYWNNKLTTSHEKWRMFSHDGYICGPNTIDIYFRI